MNFWKHLCNGKKTKLPMNPIHHQKSPWSIFSDFLFIPFSGLLNYLASFLFIAMRLSLNLTR